MSKDNNKEKTEFKEELRKTLELPPSPGGKFTKKEIIGSIASILGIIVFVGAIVLGFLSRFSNDPSLKNTYLILTIVCAVFSIVSIVIGTAFAKGKKGFRKGKGGSSEVPGNNNLASPFNDGLSEKEVSKREKEHIELISQYERLYEQGLITKEELERRKKEAIK